MDVAPLTGTISPSIMQDYLVYVICRLTDFRFCAGPEIAIAPGEVGVKSFQFSACPAMMAARRARMNARLRSTSPSGRSGSDTR
jgi:hypothetical protein